MSAFRLGDAVRRRCVRYIFAGKGIERDQITDWRSRQITNAVRKRLSEIWRNNIAGVCDENKVSKQEARESDEGC